MWHWCNDQEMNETEKPEIGLSLYMWKTDFWLRHKCRENIAVSANTIETTGYPYAKKMNSDSYFSSDTKFKIK